jgi:putative SOS response-associated peptidase YedK
VIAELHDRMPIVLSEGDWPKWLGEESATEEELLALLKPCADDAPKIWPFDKAVGKVMNTWPRLAQPIDVELVFI